MDAASHERHLWLMVLCCVVAVATAGIALSLGASLSAALVLGLVLLRPFSHMFMMMRFGHGSVPASRQNGGEDAH